MSEQLTVPQATKDLRALLVSESAQLEREARFAHQRNLLDLAAALYQIRTRIAKLIRALDRAEFDRQRRAAA